MVHVVTYAENNIDSVVEVTEKESVLDNCFYDILHLSLQIINGFYGIRFWS